MSARASQLRAPRTRPHNPGLRLVRRRSRGLIRRSFSTSLAPVAILTSIVVATAVVAVLLEQVVLAQSAFKLSRVREQVEVAETRHQELLLEVTRLGSPGRIERVAMEELGMVPPDSQRTEYVVANVKGVTGGSLVARSKATRPLQPGTGVAAGTVVEDVP